MAQGSKALAEEAVLENLEAQADRPLQLLLCAGEFSLAMVLLQRGDQVDEEMAVFTSIGRPKLQFNYPENWTIKELQGLSGGRTGVDIKLTVRDEI